MKESARAKTYERLYSADAEVTDIPKSARAQAYGRLYSQKDVSAGAFPQRSWAEDIIVETNRAAAEAARNKKATPDYGRGNINLNDNATPWLSGNKYTVYTDTATNEKVIIPAFSRTGYSFATALSDEQAAEQYRKTGKYYAKFALPSASEQQMQDIHNSFGIGALKTQTVDEQIAAYIKELQERDTDEKIKSRNGPLLTPEEFGKAAAADAQKRAEQAHSRTFGDANRKAGAGLGLAVASGVQNFTSGIRNINPAYRHNGVEQGYNTGFQNVVAKERSEMSDGNRLVFDFVSNMVQNAPSMAVGALTGSGIMSSALMFATTFGNDLQYAEAAGADTKAAYTYAFLDGVAQAFLEQVGVVTGTKGLTDTLMDGVTANVKSAVGKFLINTVGDMVGEGAEEMVQTAIENGLKNAILGEKNNASLFSEEALYAALLGALSGGVMGSVNLGVSAIANNTAADTQMREAVREMLENQVIGTGIQCHVEEEVYQPVARLAGELGISVRFQTTEEIAVRDENGDVISIPNGRYDPLGESGTGTVVLNADASTAAAVEFLLKHELTHAMQGTTEWTALETAARRNYGDSGFESAVMLKQSEYLAKGIELDRTGVIQEVVADWVGHNLYRENFIETILQHGDGAKTQGIVQRFRAFFDKNKSSGQDASMQRLERLFRKGIEHRNMVESTVPNGGASVYFVSADENKTSIKQQLQGHLEELQAMDPVADIHYTHVSKGNVQEMALEEFRKYGYKVERRDFGTVLIGPDEINRSINYIGGPAECAALLAVPRVIKRGMIIDGHEDHKGRAYSTVTIAAPVTINGTEGVVGVVVRRTGKNRYQTHRILMPDGSTFVYEEKTNAEPTTADMLTENGNQGTAISSASDTTIPQDGTGVNSYDMRNGGENSQFSFGDGSGTDIFGTSAGEATPIGNETAAAEAETFAADADDIAVGHSLETTPPTRQSRATSPDKGRQGVSANSQALGNLDNVVDLSFDSELAQRVAGLHGSAKYTIIQNYILEALSEQPITLSDGKQAVVDINDAKHLASKAGNKKTSHIAAIKEIVERAILVAEEDSTKVGKFDQFYYYEAHVRIGEETYPIYLNVGRSKYDGTYHIYDITQKLRDTAHRLNGVGRPVGYALEAVSPNDSIRNSTENVKENSTADDIPDAEDAVAEVERKVVEKETAAQQEVVDRQQRLTKAEREISAERVALREQLQRGEISGKEFDKRQQQLDVRLREETAKKYHLGDKYDAKARAVMKNAGAEYRETVEQREREKRMAKKCTEIRRSIHTTVDELAAKLARPSKNRFIPPDLVSSMQELLKVFEATPESIDNRVWELKKKILEATDEGKKARLQKRLDNLQNRNRLARENVQKIKIAYGKFCEEMSYGGEQHKFAVQKIKEDLDKLSDALFDTELDDMSYEDLRNVFNVVRGVAFQVNNAQKLFCAEHRGELQEQGKLGIDELLDAVAFYDKGLLHFNGIKKLVNWQLTPDRFFKMLGGFKKDSVWERVYNSFKEGQKRYFAIQREFDEFFKEFTEDKAFKHLADFKEKHLVDVGLKDKNGKPVMLTRGMMLSLYMHLVCNMETVIWSGLEIPALKTYYEYGITKDAYKNGTRVTRSEFCDKLWELTEQMKMTQDPTEQSRIQEELTKTAVLAQQSFENILQNIRGELTAYETKFIEKAETWFNEISKNHINETTTQVFGYPKAMVERYFRIRRDTDFAETEIAGLAYNQTIENMGTLKNRVKNQVPMLLTDLMDELTANCNDVARIVGFMAPETDFRRLYNVHDKNMQHSVKEVLRQFGSERGVGVSANQYIENLLTDLTFGRKFEQGPLGWLYRNSVRAVMTLNPRVAMIQLAAGPTSAAHLGWKTWAKGGKYLFKKPPIDKINKYSIYGYVRNNADGGMQEFSVARQGHGVIDHLYNFVDDKTNGWFFGWCQKVDQGLVNSLWFTSEEKIRETRPDLKEGTEEYYQAVGEMLDEVIIKTQSNGTALEKPDLLRNKSAIMKPFTMFKTDTMQQFNILFEGHMTLKRVLADFKAGKATKADVREAKGKYANAVTGAIVGGMAFAMIMRALANFLLKNTDKYRDEDGEVTASSVALAATNEMLGSMAGLVTFGDYIYEVVAAQVFNERYYGISDMGLETASELLSTFANADFSDGKTWKKLFFNFTDVFGIPADNVRKMVEAIGGHIKDIENGEFLKLNSASESTVSQYYSRLYKALRAGDTARAERARNTLRGLGKSDAEILTGMRAAIRKADDKQQKSVFDDMFADMRATGLYNRLTEEEKQKVQSGIKGYIADVMLADITGEKMTAAHQKAEKYAKRGVPEADYFLAQVVKDAFFADKDKDGDVSRAEYAAALEDAEYTARIRAMLLGLKK